jgi:hypothetical protein
MAYARAWKHVILVLANIFFLLLIARAQNNAWQNRIDLSVTGGKVFWANSRSSMDDFISHASAMGVNLCMRPVDPIRISLQENWFRTEYSKYTSNNDQFLAMTGEIDLELLPSAKTIPYLSCGIQRYEHTFDKEDNLFRRNMVSTFSPVYGCGIVFPISQVMRGEIGVLMGSYLTLSGKVCFPLFRRINGKIGFIFDDYMRATYAYVGVGVGFF